VMAPQTIVYTSSPPNPALVGDSYNVTVTKGMSGNPVVLTSLALSVCSISGNTVKLLAPGSCVIAANQAGRNGYAPAPQVTQAFNVFLEQIIRYTSRSPNKPVVGGTYVITATGGASGSPIVFSSVTPGLCSVTQSTVNFLAVGKCTIAANQGGTDLYAPAPEITQTMNVR
jgi:hypothetical protein